MFISEQYIDELNAEFVSACIAQSAEQNKLFGSVGGQSIYDFILMQLGI